MMVTCSGWPRRFRSIALAAGAIIVTALIVLVVAAAGAWVLPPVLAATRWTGSYPRAGIVAWCLLFAATFGSALAAGLSMLLHLPPLVESVVKGHSGSLRESYAHLGGRVLDSVAGGAVLVLGIASAVVVIVGARRNRHSRMEHLRRLEFVARPLAGAGVLLVDTHQPAAYAVPGKHGTVVITTAARERLSVAEMDAVLAHERTHLKARHHRLLAITHAFAAAMPWLPSAREGHRALSVLVEMRSDDVAARRTSPLTTATALVKLAGSVTAPTALGMASTSMEQRVQRLLERADASRRAGRLPMLAVITGLACGVALCIAALGSPIATAALDAVTCALPLDADCVGIHG